MQTDLPVWAIYLDTCCLSRLFDEQTQLRVRQEAVVISRILDWIRAGYWHWISSDVLVEEVDQTPDPEQRFQVKGWLTNAHQTVSVGAREISRGKHLEGLGFKKLDALHIACAESGGSDIFLTTDDGLIKTAKRNSAQLGVRVENPYTWLGEIGQNEHIGIDR